jgi:hypothetical protein
MGANPRTSGLETKGENVILFQKDYLGFESFSDYWRDVEEAVSPNFNMAMENLPAEFQGTVRVTISYEPAPSESNGLGQESK